MSEKEINPPDMGLTLICVVPLIKPGFSVINKCVQPGGSEDTINKQKKWRIKG